MGASFQKIDFKGISNAPRHRAVIIHQSLPGFAAEKRNPIQNTGRPLPFRGSVHALLAPGHAPTIERFIIAARERGSNWFSKLFYRR
jgi:hypothetical protein